MAGRADLLCGAPATITHASGVRHECFFLRSGADRIFASLYVPPAATTGVLVCTSWGMEGRALLEWSHRFAHEVAARAGVASLVPHWPGTQDSEGDPLSVTFDRLAEVGRDAVAAAAARCGIATWSVAGLRVGAAAGALVAPTLDAPWLLLVQPALDPATYFAEIERSFRRASLGADVPPDWALGHPLPASLRDPVDTARIASAISSFRGAGAVVQYRRPAAPPSPEGFRSLTVWGDWRRPPRIDHGPLRVTAVRWVRRTMRTLR